MKLVIVALDESWKEFYELAEFVNTWDEIGILFLYEELNKLYKYRIYSEEEVDFSNTQIVIAGLTPSLRQEQFDKWKQKGANFATLIHPQTYIYSGTIIGEGTVVFKGVIVYADSKIEENVVLLEYSSVSHDSIIGQHSVIMEKVTQGGHGIVGKRNLIKANTVIKESVTTGNDIEAECGSVILKDIADGEKVFGNPARCKK